MLDAEPRIDRCGIEINVRLQPFWLVTVSSISTDMSYSVVSPFISPSSRDIFGDASRADRRFCIRGVQSPLFFTVVQLLLNVSLGPINRTDFVQHLHDGFIRAAVQRTFKRANSGSNTEYMSDSVATVTRARNVDALSS